MADRDTICAIRGAALPLNGGPHDHDALIDLVGNRAAVRRLAAPPQRGLRRSAGRLLRTRPVQPLFTSIGEVLAYLDKVDPRAAGQARQRYACFDHYREDSQH